MEIQLGITEIDKIKESLFQVKKYFYGDFKFDENLRKVPDPINLINDAITCLETVIREAMKIEINSL